MDQKKRKRSAELLAPAGSMEGLKAALSAGADAVYMGGRLFSARAYADNADQQQMIESIDLCHLHGRKLYMTVNTLLREEEAAKELISYLTPYYEAGLDGVLVQDLGVLKIIRSIFPDLPVHASTQMSVQSADGAEFLKELGVARIVPARELSLAEVRTIYEKTGLEIECFVHGALCYSYSGQCLLSSLIGGRSGNRGRCAQPCRQSYILTDGHGNIWHRNPAYLLSLKDIQTLPLLGRLIENGVYSFKIEGRMKRPEYAAGVTGIYRKYLDRYLATGNASYQIDPEDERVLMDLFNRGGFSQGYYEQYHGPRMMSMNRPNHAGTKAARVIQTERGTVKLKALENLYEDDALENASIAGNSHRELKAGHCVQAGETFSLKAGKELKSGDTLNRVRCEQLLSSIREKTQNISPEKIKGIFILREGTPAILKVEYPVRKNSFTDKPALDQKDGPGLGQKDEPGYVPETGREEGSSVKAGDAVSAIRVTVKGPVPDRALKKALSREDLEKQIRKTGGTPFAFENLSIEAEEGLFFPIAQINQMRRDALEKLQEEILSIYRRRPVSASKTGDRSFTGDAKPCEIISGETGTTIQSIPQKEEPKAPAPETEEHKKSPLHRLRIEISVSNLRQAQTAAESGLADLLAVDSLYYMDDLVRETGRKDFSQIAAQKLKYYQHRMSEKLRELSRSQHAHAGELYLSLPPVWRKPISENYYRLFGQGERDLFDGFILCCQDQLGAVREIKTNPRQKICADSRLYVWNRQAATFLSEHGADEVTVGIELNHSQMTCLLGHANPDTALTVYGTIPVMTSAQCLRDNTTGCDRKPGEMFLRDKTGASFPVCNHCGICTNIIGNSLPLSLLDCAGQILKMHPYAVRLCFTDEDEKETRRILEAAERSFRDAENDKVTEQARGRYTHGHFRRGVQ